jgi:hypothetical protein
MMDRRWVLFWESVLRYSYVLILVVAAARYHDVGEIGCFGVRIINYDSFCRTAFSQNTIPKPRHLA